jgi:hypothetical protein
MQIDLSQPMKVKMDLKTFTLSIAIAFSIPPLILLKISLCVRNIKFPPKLSTLDFVAA